MASLTSAINDYAIVGESVVKLTKKKPLAYWNSATGAELLLEHAKQENTFRRKLASGFIGMFDNRMTNKFNSTFGPKQLMETMVGNVVIGELSGYPKYLWSTFLLQWISEPNTGQGFDYVRQTGFLQTILDGNIYLTYASDNQTGTAFRLECKAGGSNPVKVANGTPARITFAFVTIGLDSPILPNIPDITYVEIISGIANDSQGGFDVVFPNLVGSIDTRTYVLARIEILEVNPKGGYKSKDKGVFDTLQVVGVRY